MTPSRRSNQISAIARYIDRLDIVAIMIYTNDCIPRRLFSNYTGYILYCASIRRPRQPLNNQNNGSVSFLPLLNHLLCINTFSQLHRQE